MTHSPRLLLRLLALTLAALACTVTANAGDLLRWKPARAALPDPIATLPGGGTISSEALRGAVRSIALARPHLFALQQEFCQSVMIEMEAFRLDLPAPTAEAVETRLTEEIEFAGGAPALQDRLRLAGMSHADLLRTIRQGLQFEMILRARQTLTPDTPIHNEQKETLLVELLKQYEPQWHGLNAHAESRAATVGGRDFSIGEVVEWILLQGRAPLLRRITLQLVHGAFFRELGEAHGIETANRPVQEIARALWADRLLAPELAAYAETHRDELSAIRVRWIRLPIPNATPEEAATLSGINPAVVRTRLKAEAFLERIRSQETTFAAAAQEHSEHPSASSGGDLGYLVAYSDIAVAVPPAAYALDYRRVNGSPATPLATEPMPGIWKIVRAMKDGEIAGPIRLQGSYLLLERLETRTLMHANHAEAYLSQRILAEQMRRALANAQATGELVLYWDPASRDGESDGDTWATPVTQ